MTHLHYIHRHTKHITLPFLVGIMLCLVAIPVQATSITNNVSISTDGAEGSSHATVKTTVNGEIVEDYEGSSNDSSISYTSYTEANGDTNIISHSTTSTSSNEAEVRTLLEQLLALLNYYVSILNQ